MDFFERQEAARKRTGLLVVLFGLAVVGIVLAIYAVVAAWIATHSRGGGLWHPQALASVAVGVAAVVGFASLYKISMLRSGGHVVAESLGGRHVPPETDVLEERRFLNVVEEMAIASGVPVPPVYVLDDQESINAFAAGYTPRDAVIAVTRGLLRGLDRDEMQGVIAHEFSHVLNGDMRLNLRLMGLLFGILALTVIGRTVLRGVRFRGGGRGKGGSAGGLLLLVALALFVVGYIGVFFGKLIQSAVSRQREFLADASAVQFTRNPGGIAGALKKIGGLVRGSRIDHPRAEEASHMYFGNGVRAAAVSAFATHPPLAERIRRIDPSFDGEFPPFELPSPAVDERAPAARAAAEGLERLRGPLLVAAAASPERILDEIGRPMLEHVRTVRRLFAAIPAELIDQARAPFGARAVWFALLLDARPDERERQLAGLRGDATVLALTRDLAPRVAALAPEQRIPLADLAVRALRTLSPDQHRAFRTNVDALIASDPEVTAFEYTMRGLLVRHVDSFFGPVPRGELRLRTLAEAAGEASCVLSVLARAGHDDEASAERSFREAAAALGPVAVQLLPEARCRIDDLDVALGRLDGAPAPLKRRLVSACLVSLVRDGVIRPREALLFRAVSDALGVPVPPAIAVS